MATGLESSLGSTPSGPTSVELRIEFQLAFPYRNSFRSIACLTGSEMNVKFPCPSPIQKTIMGEPVWDIQIRSASPSRSMSSDNRLPGSDSPESNESVFVDDFWR